MTYVSFFQEKICNALLFQGGEVGDFESVIKAHDTG